MKHPLGSVPRTKGVVLFIYAGMFQTYAVQRWSKNYVVCMNISRLKPNEVVEFQIGVMKNSRLVWAYYAKFDNSRNWIFLN